MIADLCLGDSIAVGLGTVLPCETVARVGASSSRILGMSWSRDRRSVVISAGSNNPADPDLFGDLVRIRQRLDADRVVWILPRDRRAAGVALQVCRRFRDLAVDLASLPSPDGVHPSSYRRLADATRRAQGC